MQKRHQNRVKYFEEQGYTTTKYVIPLIIDFRKITPETTIFEIGCGEGGNLKPFLDLGCRVTGVDMSEHKIELARSFLDNHPYRQNLTLLSDDVYNLDPEKHQFDVIIMRDVIEHIHDQERFMHFIKPFLKPEGVFFLAFPPWQNPFGGHQQVCRNRLLSKLPYFHLLPAGFYARVLRSGGESDGTITSLLEVKETGLTIERFLKITRKAGYQILFSRYYFLNPNYEVKFRLKPVMQCRLISCLPVFRNFFTTSVYYLLTQGAAKNESS